MAFARAYVLLGVSITHRPLHCDSLSAVACLDKAPLYSDGGVGTVVPAGSLRPLAEGPCGTTYKALYTKFSRTLRGHLQIACNRGTSHLKDS
jgi:hypothetical protein